jgi:hypothetical protein
MRARKGRLVRLVNVKGRWGWRGSRVRACGLCPLWRPVGWVAYSTF